MRFRLFFPLKVRLLAVSLAFLFFLPLTCSSLLWMNDSTRIFRVDAYEACVFLGFLTGV